jgi:hypothetical protein
VTPLQRVFDLVGQEAKRRGCAIAGSEIIGLVPRNAMGASSERHLKLENFSPERIIETRLAEVGGILPRPPDHFAEASAALQPLMNTLREAVQNFSERSLDASYVAMRGSQPDPAHDGPERDAEAHLEAAYAAVEIYERLVQLESMSAPSMLVDWLVVKQAAMAAARGALENAEALLPSLRDAGTFAKIKSGTSEIEAKLSGKTVVTGN